MHWTDSTQKQPISDQWFFSSQLEHTDPYLMWYALTEFAGARLPSNKSSGEPLIPTLLELSAKPTEGDDPLDVAEAVADARQGIHYRTKAHTRAELQTLVSQGLGGEVLRFEISPGIEGDTPLQNLQNLKQSGLSTDPARHSIQTPARPLVGFIDYGCAFAHRQFQDGQGRTRVIALWDQAGLAPPAKSGGPQLQWRLPPAFLYGRETHRDRSWSTVRNASLTLGEFVEVFRRATGEIDEVACYRASGYEPVIRRRATHGTHVMDLATGAPAPHLQWLDSILPGPEDRRHDADIAFVQLPRWLGSRSVGGMLRANVLDAVRYLLTCATKGQPVVINLSYGGNAGPHDGTSVFEQALDWRLGVGARALGSPVHLVMPAGNAREGRMHAVATVPAGGEAEFHWENPPDDPSDSFIEFWADHTDGLAFEVRCPEGPASTPLVAGSAHHLDHQGCPVAMLVFPRRVCQSTRGRMALLAVTRTRRAASRPTAPYGRWIITVKNTGTSDVRVDAWCDRDDPAIGAGGLPRQARFVDGNGRAHVARVEQDGTLNSIAHGRRVEVVGARYAQHHAVLPYSGSGPGRGLPSRTRHAAQNAQPARRGPDLLMPGSQHPTMPGLPGAGVLSGDIVRMEGTSQACALATRRALEDQLGPKRPVAAAPSPRQSGRHPDEDLLGARRLVNPKQRPR